MEKLTEIIDYNKISNNTTEFKFNDITFKLNVEVTIDEAIVSLGIDFDKLPTNSLVVRCKLTFIDELNQIKLYESVFRCNFTKTNTNSIVQRIWNRWLKQCSKLRVHIYIYQFIADFPIIPPMIYDKNEEYLMKSDNYDVIIYTLDEHNEIYEFKAHSQILSIHSEYFRKILCTMEKNAPYVIYTCIHPQIMWAILKFIYCFDVNICDPTITVPINMQHKVIDQQIRDKIILNDFCLCCQNGKNSELHYWFELLYVSNQYKIDKIKVYVEKTLFEMVYAPNVLCIEELGRLKDVSTLIYDLIKSRTIEYITHFMYDGTLKKVSDVSKKFILDMIK